MKNLGYFEDFALTLKGIFLHQKELSKSQYWSKSQLLEYQFNRCKAILTEAFNNTPYYKDLFRKHDFNPVKDFKELSDLERIPMLSKPVVMQRRSELINPKAFKHSFELRTSGSTGDVFSELVSKNHWIVEQGMVWRHWNWLNYRFRDRMAIVRSYAPKKGQPLFKFDKIRNFLYFSAYHLTLDNAKEYLHKMRDWRPQVLRGYASSLYILARMAEELKIEMPPPKGILTASETVLPQYRETIERVFQAKIFDWYGQAEATVTMNECEKHEGMHINMEYGICELVKDESLAPNERRIVATSLHNFAMPLIRYETGDIAVLADKSDICSCGRGLPLIKAILGRCDDFLYTPDGRIIPSVNLYTMMYHYNDVLSFQFIQVKKEELEVRIKLKNDSSATPAMLLKELREKLGESISISLFSNREFIQTLDGKKKVIHSKIHDAK